jgi:hypothetical protein
MMSASKKDLKSECNKEDNEDDNAMEIIKQLYMSMTITDRIKFKVWANLAIGRCHNNKCRKNRTTYNINIHNNSKIIRSYVCSSCTGKFMEQDLSNCAKCAVKMTNDMVHATQTISFLICDKHIARVLEFVKFWKTFDDVSSLLITQDMPCT